MGDDLSGLLAASPLPAVDGGKDSRGDLVIVGGSPSCPGSALLAGRAALRGGAGRVQLVVHPEVAAAVGAAFPEALVVGWDHHRPPPPAVTKLLGRAAAVIVGPGLDHVAPSTAAMVGQRVDDGVLVVDARAIPALADPAFHPPPRCLAAPNPTEAARLLNDDRRPGGEDPGATEAALEALARGVSRLVGGPAAVRGETTVLDDGEGRRWHERSTVPGLGTPGSGDVLMGALGAFLARGVTPLVALAWAIGAHARAGTILGAAHPVGFLAREVADALPAALAALDQQGG